VARVGFDWPSAEPVRAKLAEELAEFDAATDEAARGAELGDLLFSAVNIARWYGLDPESILRDTVRRFSERFAHVEQRAQEMGRPLEELTSEEMDALWEEAKETE